MKKHILFYSSLLFLLIVTASSTCDRKGPEIKYYNGTFPTDTVFNLEGINSSYDDYNSSIPQIAGTLPIMFSTNRQSSGGEFDITTGIIVFAFNQINADFMVSGEMYETEFFAALENKVNESFDQLGPYRFFNSKSGSEYFLWTNDNGSGDLDIEFLKYTPTIYGDPPILYDPIDATRINSSENDGYITFDWTISNLYITSDRNGDYDIFTLPLDPGTDLDVWLAGTQEPMIPVDSVNSISDDKCPFVFDNYMVFTSDRQGGFGGFDLYYSKFVNGKWSSPINFGPTVNSAYNEYRPVMGLAPGYTNQFMIFSSDRPGGKGGYDLYFTGVTFE